MIPWPEYPGPGGRLSTVTGRLDRPHHLITTALVVVPVLRPPVVHDRDGVQ